MTSLSQCARTTLANALGQCVCFCCGWGFVDFSKKIPIIIFLVNHTGNKQSNLLQNMIRKYRYFSFEIMYKILFFQCLMDTVKNISFLSDSLNLLSGQTIKLKKVFHSSYHGFLLQFLHFYGFFSEKHWFKLVYLSQQ